MKPSTFLLAPILPFIVQCSIISVSVVPHGFNPPSLVIRPGDTVEFSLADSGQKLSIFNDSASMSSCSIPWKDPRKAYFQSITIEEHTFPMQGTFYAATQQYSLLPTTNCTIQTIIVSSSAKPITVKPLKIPAVEPNYM